MPNIGPLELAIVAIIALILFRTQRSWVHYSGDDK
jgi:multiple sugar transport system permease protein